MPNLALRNLWHDKLRSAMTVAGVAFAVTLVFVQVGLFRGLLDNASVTIDHIDADLWVTSRNTPNVDFAHGFPEGLVQRVRSIEGVERADNLLLQFLNMAAALRAPRRACRLTVWRTSRAGGCRGTSPRATSPTCGAATSWCSTIRPSAATARSGWATTAR